jgi:Kef-type K+ transport system membrane component KefB
MSSEISIIISISLIIFFSPLISNFLKIPTVAVEIILGSIFLYFNLISNNHIFELVAHLGFYYLMFLAGLEVDLKKIVTISNSLLKRSLLYILLLYSLSITIAFYLDLDKIFIVILPLISVGLIATLKKEYGNKDWIKLSITVGLIGEIISIIVLTIVSAGLEFGNEWLFYKTIILFTIFIIFILIFYKFFHHIIWWYPELKTYLMPKVDTQERDIRLSMAIFFLMISFMIFLKLEIALGAFLAGIFIITFFEHNKQLPRKLEHFGFGWLVPIFFIYIGVSLNIESVLKDDLITTALLITFAMISIRVLSASILIKDLGHQKSLLIALSHSMPLTLLIAVASLAYHNNSLSEFYYYAFILASILEVLIIMILIRLVHTIFIKFNNK